jgi:hypothetical protein
MVVAFSDFLFLCLLLLILLKDSEFGRQESKASISGKTINCLGAPYTEYAWDVRITKLTMKRAS